MAYDQILQAGATSQMMEVALRSSSSGQLLTGVVYGSITVKYIREGSNTQITVSAVTMTQGTFASGGWVETGIAGVYQFGIPDAAIAAGAKAVTLVFSASGAIDVVRRIVLVAEDLRDALISSRNAIAPLDAAGTRAAVGLAAANLDTQLDNLPTAGENRDAVITGLQAEDPPVPVNVTYQNGETNTLPAVAAAILEDTGTTLPGLMAAELSNTSDSTASGAISRTRGNTWLINATIGAITGYTSLWFTVKHSKDDADADAILQIKKNASETGDGLIYKNGSSDVTAGNGSITVSDASTGAIVIALDEADTDDMPIGAFYYDIQALISDTITTPDSGTFTVTADVTRSIT